MVSQALTLDAEVINFVAKPGFVYGESLRDTLVLYPIPGGWYTDNGRVFPRHAQADF